MIASYRGRWGQAHPNVTKNVTPGMLAGDTSLSVLGGVRRPMKRPLDEDACKKISGECIGRNWCSPAKKAKKSSKMPPLGSGIYDGSDSDGCSSS